MSYVPIITTQKPGKRANRMRRLFFGSSLSPIEDLDIEKIELSSKKDQAEFRNAAKQFIKKETKMNIRVPPYELQRIKEQAAKEGLKYQTFVKSVLHKYLTGQLIDKNPDVA